MSAYSSDVCWVKPFFATLTVERKKKEKKDRHGCHLPTQPQPPSPVPLPSPLPPTAFALPFAQPIIASLAIQYVLIEAFRCKWKRCRLLCILLTAVTPANQPPIIAANCYSLSRTRQSTSEQPPVIWTGGGRNGSLWRNIMLCVHVLASPQQL